MLKRKLAEITSQRLDANRRNAQRSTGPRTTAGKIRASRNRYQHGRYATPEGKMREIMLQLDEEPDLLAKFEADLTEAWRPEDAAQAMIVADLARLYWKKSQLARNLIWLRQDEARVEEAHYALFRLKAKAGSVAVDEFKLEQSGYRGHDMHMDIMVECMSLLKRVWRAVRERDWHGEAAAAFQRLYGAEPTAIGSRIIALFEQFAQAQKGSGPPPSDDDYQNLLALIGEEQASIQIDHHLYMEKLKAEFMESTGSSWLPANQKWGVASAQDCQIGRQIERQMRLMISLKRLNKKRMYGLRKRRGNTMGANSAPSCQITHVETTGCGQDDAKSE